MEIDGKVLIEQRNAISRAGLGQALYDAEVRHGLPRRLLYAVGSRETNLSPLYWDGTKPHADGHGYGAFGWDDRSHVIPRPFTWAVQCDESARVLRANADHFLALGWTDDLSRIKLACSAYNAGVRGAEKGLLSPLDDCDLFTAHGNYGRDVLERMQFLQAQDAR